MKQLTLSECAKRKLDETYLIVYTIKNEINLKKCDHIEKSNIYSLIGIDLKGYRQFLNTYQDRITNTRFWLDCFEGLKSRGLKNILFLSVDDNKNIKRTAKIAFPQIIFVDSITHIVPKFYKYTSEKDARKLASKIHALYTQRTFTECKENLKHFSETYNNAIHQKLIQKYLGNLESLYKYSHNIRLLLFKHSANMEFYDKIRLLFDSNKNYRNGYNKKNIKTEYGDVQIETSRDRNGEFTPQILSKRFSRCNKIGISRYSIQLCIIHQIRNSFKYISWKDQKEFIADLKGVYKATNEE